MTHRVIGFVSLLAVLGGSCALAKGRISARTVNYRSGNERLSGFLVVPATSGRHPALVVIHEWWGLNDWVKEQAEKLGEQGYVALAVDLYRGQATSDPSVAHQLARGLPHDRALRDLEAAFNYLASRPDVNSNKIGSIGWCMGGGYSMELAIHEAKLAACVVNYGALPTDPEDIDRIHAPVLGNFGAEDRGIPPAAVSNFEKAMGNAHKKVNVKIYAGAGHAFENPNNKMGYRPQAARDAWNRTIAFLAETLK
jgi:carboxymethylenebutenolidase